jgi:AcrR family transcriptional regulator
MRLVIDESKAKTALPRIMRAAVRLFVAKGIEATTIKDIAGKADVAEGALYRHFPSKEELAGHLFTVNLDRFSKAVAEHVAAAEGASQRLRSYISAVFGEYEADPELFYFLILAEHQELRRFMGKPGHPGKILENILREGQKSGEIKKASFFVLVSLWLGTLHRLCLLRRYGLVTPPLTSQVDEVHALLWNAAKA